MLFFRRLIKPLIALTLAIALWLPLVHLVFQPTVTDYRQPRAVAPQATLLAERHLKLWTDPALRAAEINRMRQTNAEWEFDGRTFFVLSLANMACADPAHRDENLAVMDRIIDETMRLEQEKGMYFFLMDYARSGAFVARPARSTFLDGEIALMLAARRLVQEKPEYREPFTRRVDALVSQMSQSPVLCGESYPNECWIFCNSVAIDAIRLDEVLDHRDHGAFIRRWLDTAKAKLIDSRTGLLISTFAVDGTPTQGPLGSSIWMAAHCLALVDETFARDQYERAKAELIRRPCGFAYAREWPVSWPNTANVDSGPIVPVVGASAGSSGLAFLGAATFEDGDLLGGLLTSLNFAGFPVRDNKGLRYAASNQVGDAVLLYALVQGPLWQRAREGGRP